MFDVDADRKTFVTADGAELSYLEAGAGRPFVMVPGWSQSAVQWHHQINYFAKSYRVLAIDLRGHGESANTEYGYRIYRLARDLREFLEQLDLDDVVLMGHSRGCSVLWGPFDLYGADRIHRLILVDEPASLSDNATLNDETRPQAGAILAPMATYDLANALAADASGEVTAGFIVSMFSPDCPKDLVEGVIAQNMKLPRKAAAELLIDHVGNDWRDVFSRISVPTLCVGGRISHVPWTCVVWQAEQIPGAEVEIFEAEEGGAHFMFMENPAKFNARLEAFLS